jgi:hypothetical protein
VRVLKIFMGVLNSHKKWPVWRHLVTRRRGIRDYLAKEIGKLEDPGKSPGKGSGNMGTSWTNKTSAHVL